MDRNKCIVAYTFEDDGVMYETDGTLMVPVEHYEALEKELEELKERCY